MNQNPLQSFINLVNFDQKTYSLEDVVQKRQQDIQILQTNLKKLEADLECARIVMQEAKKVVDTAELSMRELESKEQEEKKRLDSVKNKKEYHVVLKEISSLKKTQHDHEEKLLVSWNKFEVAKRDYADRMSECDQKLAQIKEILDKKEKELKLAQSDLKQRYQERENQKQNIPSDWLDKYLLMQSRVADPVVSVVSQSCSSCFYNLPPQDYLGLKRNKMLQCKGCYRFLYLEKDVEAVDQESTE